MSDGESRQCNWEEDVGLSEETTYVALYPSRRHAEEWMERDFWAAVAQGIADNDQE